MSSKIGSGTVEGSIEFLNQLIEKGRATKGAIKPLKTALRQVFLVVDGEEQWKNVDLKKIDVEDHIERFKNLTLGKYSTASYRVYKSRINKAKKWYATFLVNPGWAPSFSNSSGSKKPTKTSRKKTLIVNTKTSQKEKNEQVLKQNINESNRNDLIAYPFPLLNGKVVSLYLPVDLKLSDARRIGRFVESLSIDEE